VRRKRERASRVREGASGGTEKVSRGREGAIIVRERANTGKTGGISSNTITTLED